MDNSKITWDLLRAEDIEVRPVLGKDGLQLDRDGRASLLLYQDARCAMNALDKHFGPFGWQIEYKDVAGQIYGRLSIKDPETGDWVFKEDTGDKSNISEDKGLSSDILKRTIVRFGFGRELYSAPVIKVPDDGYRCSGYKVSEIDYNDKRQISHLVITNRFGKEVFRFDNDHLEAKSEPYSVKMRKDTSKLFKEPETASKEPITKDNVQILKDFCGKQKEIPGTNMESLKKFYTWYETRAEGWKNDFQVEKLYANWTSRERS